MARESGPNLEGLPQEPIDRLVGPFARFLHVEASSGLVLLVCSGVALALANSSLAAGFESIWKTPVGLSIGELEMRHSLYHWINDGLMAVFFFVIGLEVKRELAVGELQDMRKAALPIVGRDRRDGRSRRACTWRSSTASPARAGWGIPMATDIAFVVGCMAVLGSRIPHRRCACCCCRWPSPTTSARSW